MRPIAGPVIDKEKADVRPTHEDREAFARQPMLLVVARYHEPDRRRQALLLGRDQLLGVRTMIASRG